MEAQDLTALCRDQFEIVADKVDIRYTDRMALWSEDALLPRLWRCRSCGSVRTLPQL